MNKKGQSAPVVVALWILVGLGLVTAAYFTSDGFTRMPFSVGADAEKKAAMEDIGEIVESLTVSQTNKYTQAGDSSDDVEFWDLGADIEDTSLTAREKVDLSSGSVTDTDIANVFSGYTEADMDLYFEGTGNFYDKKIPEWYISYNEQTGKGKLIADGPSGSIITTDVGTFADIDAPEAVDTGLGDNGDGTVNYSISAGDGSVYVRLEIGNDEVDSDLEDVVFCVGDTNASLEGDELSALTISYYQGTKVGDIQSNILPLFSAAAGTGGYVCADMGDIEGLSKGTYQIDMTITEANFGTGDNFWFGVDDLGGWKARQYPSNNLKATAEDVQIIRVA